MIYHQYYDHLLVNKEQWEDAHSCKSLMERQNGSNLLVNKHTTTKAIQYMHVLVTQ